jgi:pimeloyl-ACP methyl ester carboxylesterase
MSLTNRTLVRTLSLVLTLCAVAVGLVQPASAARGAAPGLPTVSSGHRPGPDILYAPPPRAPQLENRGIWKAKPILVSGTQAYREGEWLYQDYLFDDHGATGLKDGNDPNGIGTNLFSPSAGTFTYPTDEKLYANNAADLVEYRVKPLANATAFRVTLNTLIDPSRTAFTIALGDSSSAVSWPHGAGVSSPAKLFLTWHGDTAELIDAATGKAITPAPTVQVDLVRRQIQIEVPHAAWDPGNSKVRTTIGVGLWDPKAGTYLAPQVGSATATTPGGGTPNGVAIVNVGPRFDEPMPTLIGTNFVDSAVTGEVFAADWRERQQSEQLSQGDVSPFFADVDFAKLAAKTTDDSDIPTSGPIDRIFASHYAFGQGVQPQNVCFDLGKNFSAGAKCIGREVGQLQPYALYVPKKPAQGWGLTLLLHSLSVNYNQFLGSHNQSELGDRGPGSLVLTPEGRGPDGFDAGVPEADTFEAWADVARHYPIDPTSVDVSGYSMGGFSTYRLLARWPDLFARGFSVVGAPGSVADQLISIRNDPLLLWNVDADELVNLHTSEQAVSDDEAAGLQFEEDLFLTADHLTLAENDEYGPGVAFLGTATVDRDPSRVSYVVDPTEDSAGVVADHAYWLSGLTTRGKGDATVEALSKGFGEGIPPVEAVQQGGGALTGGEIPALAYVSRSQSWEKTPSVPVADELVITAKNLATMTIDVARARVTCDVKLDVQTDGSLTIALAGCGRTLHFH